MPRSDRSSRGHGPSGSAPGRRGPAPAADPARLRVAVLSSHRAPGLEALLEAAAAPGAPFEVVAVLVSHADGSAAAVGRRARVPVRVHDVEAFCAARGRPVRDLSVRPDYDRATAGLLAPFAPDLLILCGYLLLATGPLLEAWPERIVSVHDADLRAVDGEGGPRYPGLHATRDAVAAGEAETRSTVHLVTRELDAGPPIVVSWPHPVPEAARDARVRARRDLVSAVAYAQRGWMMETCWGPLLVRTAGLFARDGVRIREGRAVVEGGLGPVELPAPEREGEAPAPPAPTPRPTSLRAAGGAP